MQDVTPTHRYELFPEVSPADLPQVLQAEAMRLVEQNDLEGCLNLAEWAYAQPNASAIPALCTLLQRPQSWCRRQLYGTLHRRRLWRRQGWIQMRIQAIHALERIGGREAALSVANALMYDCSEVRPHAAAALQTLRPHSLQCLLNLIRCDSSTDWPLEGMVAAIDALNGLQDRNAGPTLVYVLFGDLPLPSSHYTRSPFYQAFLLALGELAVMALFILTFGSPRPDTPLLQEMISASIALFGPLIMLNFVPCSLIKAFHRGQQRIRLFKAAANALTAIQDKRALPSLIEIALGTQTPPAQVSDACNTLRSLLPLLNADDAGLLIGLGKTERLLTSAFNRNDPQLTLAVLHALEFIGTGQSASQVSRLVNRRPTSHDALAFMEIRTEAERILPILQDRQRREEAASLLLRASSMPPTVPEQLLRPAHALDAEPVEQLLRPNSGE